MTEKSGSEIIKLMEFFVIFLQQDVPPVPMNDGAEFILSNISPKTNPFQTLFGVSDYSSLLDIVAKSHTIEIQIPLENSAKKILYWRFVEFQSSIICIALDWASIQKMSDHVVHKSLIYKEILLNILPGPVAEELVDRKVVNPKVYRHCTILFTDVVGFTELTFHMDPVSLIRRLNNYFSAYDEIMEQFGSEKIKTIGDAYMCASGLPIKKESHAIDICLAALSIVHFTNKQQVPIIVKNTLDLNNWKIRVGIHTGPAISGVVGLKKYTFDIWGDSVNIAARMEEKGTPGKIHISENTHRAVEEFFHCEYHSTRNIGTIKRMKTYFLIRLKSIYCDDQEGLVPNLEFCEIYYRRFVDGRESQYTFSESHFLNKYFQHPSFTHRKENLE